MIPPYLPGFQTFDAADFDLAERIAKRKGYSQTAYTSTSAVPGLFCLPANARMHSGVVVKIQGLGLCFLQDAEDMHFEVTE